MTKSRNKIISLTISVIAILLAITLAISIYYYPVESFSFIDTVPIKLIMIFCGLLALVFLGLFLYIFIHFPPPRRLLLIAFTIAIGSGTILNTIPIKGGRPSSRVTSRHLDHGRSSRVFISRSNRPYGLTCSQISGVRAA